MEQDQNEEVIDKRRELQYQLNTTDFDKQESFQTLICVNDYSVRVLTRQEIRGPIGLTSRRHDSNHRYI